MGKCVVHPIPGGGGGEEVGRVVSSVRNLEGESGGAYLRCDGRIVPAASYPALSPQLLPAYAGKLPRLTGGMTIYRRKGFARTLDGQMIVGQGNMYARACQTTIWQSPDAAWTQIAISTGSGQMYPGDFYSDGVWVIGVSGNHYAATKNLLSWPMAGNIGPISGAVIHGDIAYVAVTNEVRQVNLNTGELQRLSAFGNGTGSAKAFLHNGETYLWVQSNNAVYRSLDCVSWTGHPSLGEVYGGVFREGFFILFLPNGKIAYSETGEVFSVVRVSQVSAVYYDICHVDGHWVIVGDKGVVLVSREDRLDGEWADCTEATPLGENAVTNWRIEEENGRLFILNQGAPLYCNIGDKAIPRTGKVWPEEYIKAK